MEALDANFWFEGVCIPSIACIGFIGNIAMIVKYVKMVCLMIKKDHDNIYLLLTFAEKKATHGQLTSNNLLFWYSKYWSGNKCSHSYAFFRQTSSLCAICFPSTILISWMAFFIRKLDFFWCPMHSF